MNQVITHIRNHTILQGKPYSVEPLCSLIISFMLFLLISFSICPEDRGELDKIFSRTSNGPKVVCADHLAFDLYFGVAIDGVDLYANSIMQHIKTDEEGIYLILYRERWGVLHHFWI